MPTLTIQLPGLAPVSHVLKDETITIGRMKGNTIVIEDSSISLMHAKITRKNGEFYLKDLNSTNGTIVNGQPITEARLRDLDRIRFADISGHFSAEAPASEAVSQNAAPSAQSLRPPAQIAGLPPGLGNPNAPLAANAQPDSVVKSSEVPSGRSANRGRGLRIFGALIGATAALGVISFLGWRIFEINSEKWGRPVRPDQTVAHARDLRPIPEQYGPAKDSPQITGQPRPRSVDDLIRALKSDDAAERRSAAAALHSLGPESKAASASLREALKDTDPEVQMWAALALVGNQSYDKAAIPILVQVLQNDNAVLRQVACLSLGLIPYDEGEKERVIPALAEAAGKDANEDVRKAAQSALGIIAPDLVEKTAAK